MTPPYPDPRATAVAEQIVAKLIGRLNQGTAAEAISLISAALADAKREATAWQPIETAPKDGSKFIAWDRGQGCPLFTAHWNLEEAQWFTVHERWIGPMTHWMPLPEAPRG